MPAKWVDETWWKFRILQLLAHGQSGPTSLLRRISLPLKKGPKGYAMSHKTLKENLDLLIQTGHIDPWFDSHNGNKVQDSKRKKYQINPRGMAWLREILWRAAGLHGHGLRVDAEEVRLKHLLQGWDPHEVIIIPLLHEPEQSLSEITGAEAAGSLNVKKIAKYLLDEKKLAKIFHTETPHPRYKPEDGVTMSMTYVSSRPIIGEHEKDQRRRHKPGKTVNQ